VRPDDRALMFVRRTTFDDGATYDTPRYDRSRLLAGNTLDGPAIVVQRDSTTLVPPGYRARVVSNGNIHINRLAA
jgi:N-methylhydantoinase A